MIENKIFLAVVSAFGGIIIAVISQKFLNKRGLFTYFSRHNGIGMTVDDPIYGSVRVTWNETEIPHLFLSTIELTNHSMKDYESVKIRAYSNDTRLLTQRTQILGATHFLDFTDEYTKKLEVPEG